MSSPVFTPVLTLPNLGAGQSAFQFDTGELVVVETTQKDIAADPQNVTSDAHIAIRVRVWQVNSDGTPLLTADTIPKPVEAPVRMESIVASALADGTVSLDNELVSYTTAALERARNWLIVRKQLLRIPQAT